MNRERKHVSNTRPLPNPPGGTITCGFGQLGTIKPRGDGTYDYCCHTMPSPPPSGPASSQSNLSSGIGRGRVIGNQPIAPDVPITTQHGIECVQTRRGFVAVFDLDKGMQILLDSDEPFGGVGLKEALNVANSGEYRFRNGNKCYVLFPLAHHRVSGNNNDRVRVSHRQRGG